MLGSFISITLCGLGNELHSVMLNISRVVEAITQTLIDPAASYLLL